MASVAWSSNTGPGSVSLTNLATDVMTLLAEPGPILHLPFAYPRAGTLDLDQRPVLRGRSDEAHGPTAPRSAAAMRLHSYRDESHSRHFDLIGGGGRPWSIDLVSVT